MFSVVVAILSVALPVILLTRAIQGRFVSRLPFFYSYVSYILLDTLVSLGFMLFYAPWHAVVYWFGLLIWQIVEFAVLLEVSDHIFEPYPAIRSLGRFLCAAICAVFVAFYILPVIIQHAPLGTILFDLVERSCLTKAVLVLVLLATARLYKVTLGRSISGMLLGFSLYLGVNVANFELALTYGRTLYASTFRFVAPLAWILGALVWVVVLWNYEPGMAKGPVRNEQRAASVPAAAQLARFNHALLKLLQK